MKIKSYCLKCKKRVKVIEMSVGSSYIDVKLKCGHERYFSTFDEVNRVMKLWKNIKTEGD